MLVLRFGLELLTGLSFLIGLSPPDCLDDIGSFQDEFGESFDVVKFEEPLGLLRFPMETGYAIITLKLEENIHLVSALNTGLL